MKPEITALPGFEELDFSHVKKPNVTNYKGTETVSATLSEDYVKHVKDAKPISADYQKYTMEDVRSWRSTKQVQCDIYLCWWWWFFYRISFGGW